MLTCAASAEEGIFRATHDSEADRLELAGIDFHTRVNEAFLTLAKLEPERIYVIASNDIKSVTAKKVFAALSDLFPFMNDESICTQDFFLQLDEPEEDDDAAPDPNKPDPNKLDSNKPDLSKPGVSFQASLADEI